MPLSEEMKIKSDGFASFLSLPAPRHVDNELLDVIFGYFFPKGRIILIYSLVVLMLIVVAGVLGIIVSSGNYGDEIRLRKGPLADTQGRIVEIYQGKDPAAKSIYKYKYTYQTPSKKEVTGFSFSGRDLGRQLRDARIEYLIDDPKISRMKNTRVNPTPIEAVFLLPVISFLAAVMPFLIMRGKKRWIFHLLQNGIATTATMQKIGWGRQGMRNIGLLLNLDGKEINAKVKVPGRKRIVALLKSLKNQNRQVSVLVDPKQTRRLIIIDTLIPEKGG